MPTLFYSNLNSCVNPVAVARLAGIAHATTATPPSSRITAASVAGSPGRTA